MNQSKARDIAIFILRLCLGVIFIAHGLQKVFGFFGGPGIEGFSKMVAGIGANPAIAWAWAAALVELIGGIFLILGILPRLSAAAIGVIMVVAIVAVHGPSGFFMSVGGFEYQLLILGVCLSIVLTGAGKISLFNKL